MKPCVCSSHSNFGKPGNKPQAILPAPPWSSKKTISVDACIADAIKHLWENGVVTRGCYCGHNVKQPSVIIENTTPERAKELLGQVDGRLWEIIGYTPTNQIQTMKQIPNYANYLFADDNRCPECGFGEDEYEDSGESFEPIGYADTIYGYMAVLRCPICRETFRDFLSDNMLERLDFETFKQQFEKLEWRYNNTIIRCAAIESNLKVGDKVRAKMDLIKLADDYSPNLLYARCGEVLVIRAIDDGFYPIKVSHEGVTGKSFGAKADEIERVSQ